MRSLGKISTFLATAALLISAMANAQADDGLKLRGTGDLGLVIERAHGSIQIIDTTQRAALGRVKGLGDLSHASAVYSRDGRYAYIFGRDGGLSKVDILQRRIAKRVVQSGNSIGGAISQDGSLVAVSNYKPGGVKVFDAATLELVADIPAQASDGSGLSKVVGLADAPGQRFIFSLYNAGEIWIADFSDRGNVKLTKYTDIGELPYDGLITDDGRYYIAGLFGEDGMAMLDLWQPEKGVRRILDGYGRGEEKLPVYKMPHLEGWARAGDVIFLPAVGRHEVLMVAPGSWKEVGRIAVHGQPIFAVARPDGRQVWVNFAHPLNDTVQVIDVPSRKIVHEFKPGKAVLHLEFTPRGEQVWISVRDANRVDVYDTESFARLQTLPAQKPSGIFLTARANRIGL
ncbi:MAG: protein nirF [Rhodospirillaceae bacterium]|jgi:protein NirF|nr:protein nirF [Rhodospirillaceae bacterium]MBT3492282.1 protein nirF [Rhodospirillaceae bacterium]MBT3782323.1 protein nirF [Rhodospirillaceae bacterium]MBT3975137.1 protein nirF [Rhodospirillaceae bacterium]MBT4166775.1 protein nirF [Rhodospirillaceae bacterium]